MPTQFTAANPTQLQSCTEGAEINMLKALKHRKVGTTCLPLQKTMRPGEHSELPQQVWLKPATKFTSLKLETSFLHNTL